MILIQTALTKLCELMNFAIDNLNVKVNNDN